MAVGRIASPWSNQPYMAGRTIRINNVLRLRETMAAPGAQPTLEMTEEIINSASDFPHGGMQKDEVTVMMKRER